MLESASFCFLDKGLDHWSDFGVWRVFISDDTSYFGPHVIFFLPTSLISIAVPELD